MKLLNEDKSCIRDSTLSLKSIFALGDESKRESPTNHPPMLRFYETPGPFGKKILRTILLQMVAVTSGFWVWRME